MPTAIETNVQSGRQTVTTGGSAVALSTSIVWCKQLDVTAETDNTGTIVIGGSDVIASLSTRKGVPLGAGDTWTAYDVSLAEVFIDTTVNTDGVTFAAVI